MQNLSSDAAAQQHFLGSGEFDGGNEELRSVQLRKHIEKYKSDVKAILPGIDFAFPGLEVEGENFTMNVHGKAEKGVWERHMFESNIPVADVVLLTRLTTDIMNCEFDLANLLYKSVNADDFKFDQVRARVIPKATTIMQGDNYEADIFVAAYDSKADLRVKVNGKEIVGDAADSGSVRWVVGTAGLGVQKYSGEIYVKKESGEVAYPFSGEYFVTLRALESRIQTH
jgi:gliding motility-associated protein GldM